MYKRQVWKSSLNNYNDFAKQPVLTPTGSFDFEIFTNDFSRVKYIRGLLEPIVFTGREEWSLGQDLSPTGLAPRPQTAYGVGDVPPVHTENSLLFVSGDRTVRDIGYNFQDGGYKGNDLTLFSSHLFEGKKIIAASFQKYPSPVYWTVCDDGSVQSMTYFKEQNIFAWSEHEFPNRAVEVAAVNGEGVSHVFFSFIDENGQYTLEKLANIDRTDDRDFRFMDSHKYFDFRNKDATKTVLLETMLPMGNTNRFTNNDTMMELTLAGHEFDPMPPFIDLLSDAGYIRLVVTGVTTPKTKFKVRVDDDVPGGFREEATAGWSLPVNELDEGLDHLRDKEVSVIADGSVISSPNDPQALHMKVALTEGRNRIKLGGYYSVICVGLPFVSDMGTLPIDLRGDDTVIDQNMIVNNIALYVHNTRGLFIGSEEPEDKTSTVGLVGLKTNFDGEPEIRPENGIVRKVINGSWNNQGEIIVRQVDPLPMNLQGILVTGDLVKEGN